MRRGHGSLDPRGLGVAPGLRGRGPARMRDKMALQMRSPPPLTSFLFLGPGLLESSSSYLSGMGWPLLPVGAVRPSALQSAGPSLTHTETSPR